MSGLRERKKQETRQQISDTASWLFMQRGFDTVTVAEIAEAAGVSTKTVFNYFPRKEDLFLDRIPEATDLIARTVRERPADMEPLTALRQAAVRLVREGHPLGGIGEGYEHFARVVVNSPALRARVREFVDEVEDLLAKLFEEIEAKGPWSRVAAALVVAAVRSTYATSFRRLLDGDRPEDIRDDHIVLLNRSFDVLERALA
ncbi:TetR/AcrR family transcriptional regulator [Microtetraspora malaysiensis]|uniref:TetR/AcrR family transcriptional regulator n=1 Tax=Microtetraspora malaysiensis TaxID=161358 RepID=UPI00082C4CD9|nr:TetR/AcrR family transcriptional regulator [Microtetraspora malaysiensis]